VLSGVVKGLLPLAASALGFGKVGEFVAREAGGRLFDHALEALDPDDRKRWRDAEAAALTRLEGDPRIAGLPADRIEGAAAILRDRFAAHRPTPDDVAADGFLPARVAARLVSGIWPTPPTMSEDRETMAAVEALAEGIYTALLAQPAELQRTEPGFRRAVLREIEALPGRLREEVEALRIEEVFVHPRRRFAPTGSLAETWKLSSEYEVVPFTGRAREVESLLSWAGAEGTRMGVRLYTGQGGAGKTRLMREVCRRLPAADWQTGFFVPAAVAAGGIPRAFAGHDGRSLFGVLDYAGAAEDGGLDRVLEAALDCEAARPRVRIVLLDRAKGDWWPRYRRMAAGRLGDLVRNEEIVAAEPSPMSALGIDERLKLYDEAFRRFAPGAASSPAAPDLADPAYAAPLFVLIEALRRAAGEPTPPTGGDPRVRHLDWVLGRLYAGFRQSLGSGDLVDAARDVMAVTQLLGGIATRARADDLLDELPRTRALEGSARNRLIGALRRNLPGEGFIPTLTPDAVGQHLAIGVLDEDIDLYGARRKVEGAMGQVHALTTINEGVKLDPTRRSVLERVLDRNLPDVALDAAETAIRSGDPMGPVLAAALRAHGDPALIDAVAAVIPDRTVALREVALVVEQDRVRRSREGAARGDAAAHGRLAASLNNLSIRLSDLGRREVALAAIEEAVAIRRDLAAARPDAFRPDLARSLGASGSVLKDADPAAARDRFAEGLEAIAPYLARIPEAHRGLARALLGDYLDACATTDSDPDPDLLARIVPHLGLEDG